MEKKIYWLVENNDGLSIVVEGISQASEIIHEDFIDKKEYGVGTIEDLEYTMAPKLMTERQYSNLPEFNG